MSDLIGWPLLHMQARALQMLALENLHNNTIWTSPDAMLDAQHRVSKTTKDTRAIP